MTTLNLPNASEILHKNQIKINKRLDVIFFNIYSIIQLGSSIKTKRIN